MRAPLAPIETRPTQNARRAPGAAGYDAIEIDADLVEERDPCVRNHSPIPSQLDLTALGQSVRQRHPETAGEMVIAGPCRSQRRVSRTDDERWPLCICGRPLSGKGKRWGRCCAWSDAVICPASDAAGRQPPACMGVS